MTIPVGPGALSEREIEVLHLAADGLTNHEIAEKLHLSPHTVNSHLAHILDRLGARSRAHAVTLGHDRGYLPVPDDAARARAKVVAVRGLAARWAALNAATARDAVLRDAGRAVLKTLGDDTGGAS